MGDVTAAAELLRNETSRLSVVISEYDDLIVAASLDAIARLKKELAAGDPLDAATDTRTAAGDHDRLSREQARSKDRCVHDASRARHGHFVQSDSPAPVLP